MQPILVNLGYDQAEVVGFHRSVVKASLNYIARRQYLANSRAQIAKQVSTRSNRSFKGK